MAETTTTTTEAPTTTTTTTASFPPPSGPATFITSKSVGETINIGASTSTGYWKYYHNGTYSSVFSNGGPSQTATVANANGEFTIISCLADGTPSGNITDLDLTKVGKNQTNSITSFNGTGLTSLNSLNLQSNQLTSFDGTGLTSLTTLYLNGNLLTSFNGTGLTSLTSLELNTNQLTSFNGTGLTSLNSLNLHRNQLTSFDGTGLTSLTSLVLVNNLLTSIDVSPMVALTNLYLADSYGLNGNPMTATANNAVLASLVANGVSGGGFYTTGGRTSARTANYDALIADGWNLVGLELITPPSGNGKLRVRGISQQ